MGRSADVGHGGVEEDPWVFEEPSWDAWPGQGLVTALTCTAGADSGPVSLHRAECTIEQILAALQRDGAVIVQGLLSSSVAARCRYVAVNWLYMYTQCSSQHNQPNAGYIVCTYSGGTGIMIVAQGGDLAS